MAFIENNLYTLLIRGDINNNCKRDVEDFAFLQAFINGARYFEYPNVAEQYRYIQYDIDEAGDGRDIEFLEKYITGFASPITRNPYDIIPPAENVFVWKDED